MYGSIRQNHGVFWQLLKTLLPHADAAGVNFELNARMQPVGKASFAVW